MSILWHLPYTTGVYSSIQIILDGLPIPWPGHQSRNETMYHLSQPQKTWLQLFHHCYATLPTEDAKLVSFHTRDQKHSRPINSNCWVRFWTMLDEAAVIDLPSDFGHVNDLRWDQWNICLFETLPHLGAAELSEQLKRCCFLACVF